MWVTWDSFVVPCSFTFAYPFEHTWIPRVCLTTGMVLRAAYCGTILILCCAAVSPEPFADRTQYPDKLQRTMPVISTTPSILLTVYSVALVFEIEGFTRPVGQFY
jgi:hypothetical protein